MVKYVHNEVPTAARVASDRALEQLFELAGMLEEYTERGLAERRLTRPRAEVLWRLRRSGPVTQRELSQALRVTPRNVTGLLDGLEAGGFVERRPHPDDRRATLVALTARGRRVVATLAADHRRFAADLFTGVTDSDLRRLSTLLEQVLARLRDEVVGGGIRQAGDAR